MKIKRVVRGIEKVLINKPMKDLSEYNMEAIAQFDHKPTTTEMICGAVYWFVFIPGASYCLSKLSFKIF